VAVVVNGQAGADAIALTPGGHTQFTVNGNGPAFPAILTGDRLTIDVSGIANPALTSTGIGAGRFPFGVTFTGIERLTPGVTISFVYQLYLDLLHRRAEPGGLAYWSGLLDGGLNRFQVVRLIEASLEYRVNQVQALYIRFLHRPADPGGLVSSILFLRAGGT